MKTSENGYLLRLVVHKDTIKRVVDVSTLNITPEYIKEQCDLKYGSTKGSIGRTLDNRERPNIDIQEHMDRYYITDLCMPYNPPPDEHDVFVYYNDICALSGTAGYIRIRDGYVWGQSVVWRS